MLNQFHQKELDNYVQGVNAELSRVPTEIRSEMNEELAHRFRELVTAHEELGLSHEQAIEAAMTSLATPKRTGRRLHHAYRSRKLKQRIVRALRCVIGFTAACAFVEVVGIFAGGWGDAFLAVVLAFVSLMYAAALHHFHKVVHIPFRDTLTP